MSSSRIQTLDDVYRFAEDSFPGEPLSWNSQLRPAVGVDDGERYLIRLFRKTGTSIDDDLRHLLERGLRRIRRVLTSRRARDVLAEVIEIREDSQEIGVVMLLPGDPLSGSAHRRRSLHQQSMTASGRRVVWQNLQRVVEGLTLCHDAGIVHGSINLHTIFSHSDRLVDYRLGGYESCVQITDGDLTLARNTLRGKSVVSFRNDWMDLGKVARSILGLESDKPPALTSIELKMLERLASPPKFQLFSGREIFREVADVITELERIGSGSDGEMILFPSRQSIQSDLPSLAQGSIAASDVPAILKFVADDLATAEVFAVKTNSGLIKLVTDLATYNVRPDEEKVGVIVGAWKRRADDRVADAFEMKHRIRLEQNRASAIDRTRRSGLNILSWDEINERDAPSGFEDDPPAWFALVLLEAFSLLREQFRIYPVEVVNAPSQDGTDLVWVTPCDDAERDERRKRAGLRPSADALKRELDHDEGLPDWTLSPSDALGGLKERLPELSHEGATRAHGLRLYAFSSSEPVIPGRRLFLRPRKDAGLEQAVKRRLENIVAARTNVDLLRSIDDPAQVAVDPALVDIAAPADAPPGLDPSKRLAWKSVADGQSVSVVVGPPGVGKTYLISELIKSIHGEAGRSRILISAQNHETLINMEHELLQALPSEVAIVVRVEKSRNGGMKSPLRERSEMLLRGIRQDSSLGPVAAQIEQIRKALDPETPGDMAVAERVFRDTENLLLRSSNVTLATTSSPTIQEMIADGEQFDWVFVEEAARANGAELIGALLLGNRRVIIGDHKQLSPFDTLERQKLYDPETAQVLLADARSQLSTISDLSPQVDQALKSLEGNPTLMTEVLALARRLEEPFRAIAEREEDRERLLGHPSSIASTLVEQSRMHPAICQLVSKIFYETKLKTATRVGERKPTVSTNYPRMNAPVVVLDLPALSSVSKVAFEKNQRGSYSNSTECRALIEAIRLIRPGVDERGRVATLVFLAPYWAQVRQLERVLSHRIDSETKTLFGFASVRGDGRFCYTTDSFQGGEADVVAASLVRNNMMVGRRALGHVRSPQRMNVLLSRARQKLVLATSLNFLGDAVDGTDPDHLGGELSFIREMVSEIRVIGETDFPDVGKGASIIDVGPDGKLML